MGMLAWVMMGLAIWHFTIFLPDRFLGGIVGAFLGAVTGALISGAAVHIASGRSIGDTDLGTAIAAIPGTAIGVAIVYFVGVRREQAHAAAA